MKDWQTDEERAREECAEPWTKLHALAIAIGIIALFITVVRIGLS